MNSTTSFADMMDQAAASHRKAFRHSVLGHQEALEELHDVCIECHRPNWDGYGALPVEQEAYRVSYCLIESLPLGFPRPSISAHPDGQLTLEWYRSPTQTLSISIDPAGFIHYAGLFGEEKHFGTVPILDGIPAGILRLASKV